MYAGHGVRVFSGISHEGHVGPVGRAGQGARRPDGEEREARQGGVLRRRGPGHLVRTLES